MLLRSMLQTQVKCDHLLDNESCATGVFQPKITDPEYCNAQASTAWELDMMTSYYDVTVQQVATNVVQGAPSQGNGALPTKFLNRCSKSTSQQHTDSNDMEKYFPDSIPDNPTTKSRRYNTNTELRECCENIRATNDNNIDELTFDLIPNPSL